MPARVSLRVSPCQWKNPERLAETVTIRYQLRGTIGEVALFTHATHPAIPLPAAREAAAGIAEALLHFRRLGVPSGINVRATTGRLDESPGGLLVKAHATGRQVSWLPGYVTDIEYEHATGRSSATRSTRTCRGCRRWPG